MLLKIYQKVPLEKPPVSTARAEWHRTTVECRRTASTGLHFFLNGKVTQQGLFCKWADPVCLLIPHFLWFLQYTVPLLGSSGFWDITTWPCVGQPSGHSLLSVPLLPQPSLSPLSPLRNLSGLKGGANHCLIALSPARASVPHFLPQNSSFCGASSKTQQLKFSFPPDFWAVVSSFSLGGNLESSC